MKDKTVMEELFWKKVLDDHNIKTIEIFSSTWAVGFRDRGLGRGDYGVITENDILVVPCESQEVAEHIVQLHNEDLRMQHVKKGKSPKKKKITQRKQVNPK